MPNATAGTSIIPLRKGFVARIEAKPPTRTLRRPIFAGASKLQRRRASAERKSGGERSRICAHRTFGAALQCGLQAGYKLAHMPAVMPIATAATAITAVESQPIRRSPSLMGKSPMILGFDVICIIVTITGTATTPLMTAVQ